MRFISSFLFYDRNLRWSHGRWQSFSCEITYEFTRHIFNVHTHIRRPPWCLLDFLAFSHIPSYTSPRINSEIYRIQRYIFATLYVRGMFSCLLESGYIRKVRPFNSHSADPCSLLNVNQLILSRRYNVNCVRSYLFTYRYIFADYVASRSQ